MLEEELDLELKSDENRSQLEQERKKKVEQRGPERSSAAARIEHGVAACKELNLEL
jgi:hypothetical protein